VSLWCREGTITAQGKDDGLLLAEEGASVG
jgi:hypothetical protein